MLFLIPEEETTQGNTETEIDTHTHTFLMSVSLLTLMSMLTGVLGNASKTSLRRGMRLSSPPSQKHSAQRKTESASGQTQYNGWQHADQSVLIILNVAFSSFTTRF